ncbi:MAG TPA: ATP-binding cassette domain-containing protein [Geobacteraceae bacterium]
MKVELCGAEKSYPVPGVPGETIAAVKHASLAIDAGDICFIHGPSGSGKSTLLALMGGMAFPSGGSVLWDGRDTRTMGDIARVRGERIGFAFQEQPFFRELTVLEHLLLHLALGREGSPAEARELLDLVGLSERFDCFPAALSGGEKRRLAVAAALLRSPALLILDEPVSYLDGAWQERLFAIITDRVRQAGSTLVITAHDPLFRHGATRIFRMTDGVLHAETAETGCSAP